MSNNWSYVYNVILLAGTTFLVMQGWSAWWFVLTVALLLQPGQNDDEDTES